jgi:hypothetical protein
VRLLLPAAVRNAIRARFRLDPFPYCFEGSSVVHSIRFVPDEERAEPASRTAELYPSCSRSVMKSKTQTRRRPRSAGTPSSLSIELTPRCNLTCSHCSSHGEPGLDRCYNRMKEMTVERLERLGRGAFRPQPRSGWSDAASRTRTPTDSGGHSLRSCASTASWSPWSPRNAAPAPHHPISASAREGRLPRTPARPHRVNGFTAAAWDFSAYEQ